MTSHTATITTANFLLEGMDCSDCERVIEHRLERLDGVLSVKADFTGQTVQIRYNRSLLGRRQIEKRIRQLGYEPAPGRLQHWLRNNRELLFSLFSGFLLLLGWLIERFGSFPPQVSNGFYLLAFVPAGYDVGRATFNSLRQRHFDTDLMMFIAALGAASLGWWSEGALLLFLFSLGHALQERALERARKAVHALADLAPRTALVRKGERDVLIPVDRLQLNDIVIVRPAERSPADGEVITGQSWIDQSAITGESLPVEKTVGDHIFAGSLNGDGLLQVRVSRLAKDSTLARVMKLVEQAQATRSPAQLWVERFTRIYTPLVLLGFAALLALPVLMGMSFESAFERAVTFLVAASPCALALGTPSAILVGIAQAARNGVLVKGGVHLEGLARLRLIAFDKTGTLTRGEPQVTDIIPLKGWTKEQVVGMAAALESRASHPLGQAILQAAESLGVEIEPADGLESLSGRGMRARTADGLVWVGSPAFISELSLRWPDELQPRIQSLENQGKTVVLVGIDGQVCGSIAIADVIRPEARAALDGLAALGIRQTIMLSGDNPRAAAHIAGQLGVTSYRAELLPAEKFDAIQELVQAHHHVGMVGDGVNDAPALAQATVGIALGSARNDAALEAADVALMSPDLCKLPFAVGLGRAVQRVIVQNLVVSLGTIFLFSALGLTGFMSIGATVFLHEGTTLLVVLNALRLLAFALPCKS